MVDLSNGTKYYFRVQARNIIGYGIPSDIVNTIPMKSNIMLYVGIIGGIIVLIIIIAIVISMIRGNKSTNDDGDTLTNNESDE